MNFDAAVDVGQLDVRAAAAQFTTQAVANELVMIHMQPEIIADATFYILSRSSSACTGNTFIDEEVLASEGITDLDKYAVVAGAQLYKDLFRFRWHKLVIQLRELN